MIWLIPLLLLSTVLHAQWPANPQTVRLGKGRISELSLSPGDDLLRVTTSAGIWLHDASSLEQQHVIPGSVRSSRFSADGTLLGVVWADTSIAVYDVRSGEQRLRSRPSSQARGLTFDRSGAYVAVTGGSSEVVVLRVSTGEELARIHTEQIIHVLLDDGARHLLTSHWHGAVRTWDLADGRRTDLHIHDERVTALDLDPTGRWLISGSRDRIVRVWDLESGGYEGAQTPGLVDQLYLDPTGRLLAVRHSTSQSNGFVVYSLPRLQQVFDSNGSIPLSFVADGERLLTFDTGTADITPLDTRTWQPESTLATGDHRPAAVAQDGNYAITRVDADLYRYSLQHNRPEIKLPAFPTDVQAVVAQRDGPHIAIVRSRRIDILHVDSFDIVATARLSFNPASVHFAPDERLLATGSRVPLVWDYARHDSVSFETDSLPAASLPLWSSDTLLAVVAAHQPGATVARVEVAELGPDGRTMALGVAVRAVVGRSEIRTGMIVLWDLVEGRAPGVLTEARESVESLAFHPAGQYLASAGEAGDPHVRLWDLRALTLIDSIPMARPRRHLAFHPTRELLAFGDTPTFGPSGDVLVSPTEPRVWSDPLPLDLSRNRREQTVEPRNSNGVGIWDASTLSLLATLPVHAQDMAFVPQGDMLFTNSGGELFVHGAIDESVIPKIGAPVRLVEGGPAETAVTDGIIVTPPSQELRIWPNPFNGTVSVELGGDSPPERVAIFDLTGRQVRALVPSSVARFRVAWDGLDNAGRQVASGVYFVEATGRHGRSVGKIVRLK